jgi:hypothetical protein
MINESYDTYVYLHVINIDEKQLKNFNYLRHKGQVMDIQPKII